MIQLFMRVGSEAQCLVTLDLDQHVPKPARRSFLGALSSMVTSLYCRLYVDYQRLENKSAILLSSKHNVRSTERVGDLKQPRDEFTSHGSEISSVELGASQAGEEILV